jgi:hypothetical protein
LSAQVNPCYLNHSLYYLIPSLVRSLPSLLQLRSSESCPRPQLLLSTLGVTTVSCISFSKFLPDFFPPPRSSSMEFHDPQCSGCPSSSDPSQRLFCFELLKFVLPFLFLGFRDNSSEETIVCHVSFLCASRCPTNVRTPLLLHKLSCTLTTLTRCSSRK